MSAFLFKVAAEVSRARTNYPGNHHRFVILCEEFGEVQQAYSKLLRANLLDEVTVAHIDHLKAELVQAAAQCQRLFEELDAEVFSE